MEPRGPRSRTTGMKTEMETSSRPSPSSQPSRVSGTVGRGGGAASAAAGGGVRNRMTMVPRASSSSSISSSVGGGAGAGGSATTGAAAAAPAPPREIRRYYPAYERWLAHEAGIEAPKVQVVGFREEDDSLARNSHEADFHHVSSLRGPALSSASGSDGSGDGGDANGGDANGGDGDGDANKAAASLNFGGRTKNRPGARQHRGLYATSRIEPGEVIMRIPGEALMGVDVLRQRGSEYLEERERMLQRRRAADETEADGAESEGNTAEAEEEENAVDVSNDARRRSMERTLMATIEGLRRFSEDKDDGSSAGEGKYKWKEDDGVALFLIGCREILELFPLPPGDTSSPRSGNGTENQSDPVDCRGWSSDARRRSPSFLPHVSVLPTAFPTNRLYYTKEELDRMGGEIRTDGVAPRRKDVLSGVEADWMDLRGALGEFYRTSGGGLGMDAWRCNDCRRKQRMGSISWAAGGSVIECCGRGPNGCFVVDPEVDLTLDAYKWALSNIYSRSCDFRCGGGGGAAADDDEQASRVRRVIVPLLDMCNHDFGSPVRHTMDAHGNITVYNGSSASGDPPIEAGGEVCLNYGDFPNEKLLLCYGFFFFFGSQ